MNDQKYFVGLSLIRFIGPVKFKLLHNFFDNLSLAWKANLPDLMAAGFRESEAHSFIKRRSEIDLDKEWEKLESQNINVTTIVDASYPKLLKEIYDTPFILYYLGDISFLNYSPCISVVGAREHSAYGEQAVTEITAGLAEQGIIIISGLALGIDALAHQATLGVNGLTVAVLGSDLSWTNIGPKANYHLAKEILASGGGIISEFSLGSPTLKENFPLRNRIVSGLSKGTLVIEAGEKSGTLITANSALDQGRDVYAVPGSIYSNYSRGTNLLIKKGAKVVCSAADILEDLELLIPIKESPNSATKQTNQKQQLNV